MSQRPRGNVAHCEGCIVVLLLLFHLSTETFSAPPSAGRRRSEDVHDAGSDDWQDAFGSVWNETKFWTMDEPVPTEYFPEDEGFIRVSAQKAQQAPRPRDSKTKAPESSKDHKPEGMIVVPSRKAQGVPRGTNSETGGLFRRGRHLMDIGAMDDLSSKPEEGHEGEVEFGSFSISSENDEGSGEGSGSHSL